MEVVIRVDASLEIGTGHVMRCLTLANALTEKGDVCHFICREHPGHLLDVIEARGHRIHRLPVESASDIDCQDASLPAHAHWLGSDWSIDARQTSQYLQDHQPDWLVVDHYGLDQRWEQQLRLVCNKLMVIDDLADRAHDCDLLLDQTFGREAGAYQKWVPDHCKLLIGSKYALLRPEFAALRQYSLERRNSAELKHLLITMGGVDKDNATGEVLAALKRCPLLADCKITVVMGATAPWLTSVQEQAATLPWEVTVRVNVSDMAQLMADSDLAIGAAGSTSWERCVLGVPTLMLVLADNQREIAMGLEVSGAAKLIDADGSIEHQLITVFKALLKAPNMLSQMSLAARRICHGDGAPLVSEVFIEGEGV